MSKFCLICTLIIVSIFVTITIYSDNSPGPRGENMDGSLDANVHEGIKRMFPVDPVEIHIHSIAYAHEHHHPFGDYTISYKFELTEDGKKKWNGQKIEGKQDNRTYEFDGGCIEEFDINEEYASITNQAPGGAWWRNSWLKRSISSTIKSYEFIINEDGLRQKVAKVKAIDSDAMINGKRTPALPDHFTNPPNVAPYVAPSPGLSPVNASTITINGEEMIDAAPGDSVSVNVVMPSDKGYSYIYWYLAGPDDSGLGNSAGGTTTPSGYGIETEVTHTFSMPSDASGIYTFTAYIYPHSSASDQTVYQYSIKIYCS